MPTIESVDEMIRNQEKINAGLHKMKSMIYEEAQNSAHQRMRDQGIRGPGEYEDEMAMYGDDRQSLGYSSESKKRRGVGPRHICPRGNLLTNIREPHLPDDAIVAIGQKHPNGEGVQMVRARCAMHVGYITPS